MAVAIEKLNSLKNTEILGLGRTWKYVLYSYLSVLQGFASEAEDDVINEKEVEEKPHDDISFVCLLELYVELGKILSPFLCTVPLLYVSRWLYTQAMTNWATTNTVWNDRLIMAGIF